MSPWLVYTFVTQVVQMITDCWFVLGVRGVQITHLFVPEEVRNGTSEAAILDCEYTLTPADLSATSGLVVKWFFNSGPAPVYQWIPGQRPQVCPDTLNLCPYIWRNMHPKDFKFTTLSKLICFEKIQFNIITFIHNITNNNTSNKQQ